jgi:hypothetical protein
VARPEQASTKGGEGTKGGAASQHADVSLQPGVFYTLSALFANIYSL